MLLSWLCILSLIVSLNCDQCIRYEFHEAAINNNQEGNAELLINDCRTKNSKVTDYNAMILQIYGPPMINITFNCCSSLPCKNDLQCPFNFNCNRGKCLVADDCNLRDEIEIVGEENQECIIDEDCYFKIPLDKKHWSCLSETAECIHKENCLRKCKRCAFVGDHWSNFVNNTIDVGLYNNESPPSTSLIIDDLLPLRNNTTSTQSPPPANNLVEFSLNSLINDSGNDNNDEIIRSEGFRSLDINRNVNNNHNINISTTTVKPSTTDSIPPVNSTNRILSPNNITSLLEFINNSSGNRLNNNLNSRLNTRVTTNSVRSSPKPDTSGFTRNDLPTNILDEISSTRNVEPSSSTTSSTTTTTTTTTTTSTTTSTTTTTTPSSISSSSEESSNESNEFNNNRINHTIDDFLFTRTNNENNSVSNNTNDNNLIDLFSSIINNSTSSSSRNRLPPVDSVSVPLINSTLNNNVIRTSDPFNSPFGNLFNLPLTTSTTVPSSLNLSSISSENNLNSTTTSSITTTSTTTTTPKPLSSSAVLSAASILNRSRSAIRNTDNNNRFARRSSSLRTNPARSILNNHRLIHMPNSNNNHRINNNNRRTSTTTTTTSTSTTTNRPPIINNNPYYHLTSILNNNHNSNFNEMLPGILYAIDADIDIPRLNSTSVH